MRSRISFVTAFFLIATAVTFDLIGGLAAFVPGLGTVVAVFAYILFFLWFALLGVQFMSGKKALQKLGTMAVGFIVEALPFLGALPALTMSVILIVLITYAEDKKAAAKRAAQLKAEQGRSAQQRNRHDWSWRGDDAASRQAANDNAPEAANDNEEEVEERRAA